jgi:hypothetical protein
MGRGVCWTDEELDCLLAVYEQGGATAFRKRFPCRSVSSVVQAAFKQNLKAAVRWDDEHIAFLKKVYSSGGAPVFCGRYSDFPLHAVHTKAMRLGLRCQNFWTKDEIDFLKNVYPAYGVHEFLRRYGTHSRKAVFTKVHKLGLGMLDRWLNVRGEKSVRWCGGISYEPYSHDFNKWKKEFIKEFYGHVCLVCGREGRLAVHHIDYVKKNSVIGNLVPLCFTCHSATLINREFWFERITFLRNEYLVSAGACLGPRTRRLRSCSFPSGRVNG